MQKMGKYKLALCCIEDIDRFDTLPAVMVPSLLSLEIKVAQ